MAEDQHEERFEGPQAIARSGRKRSAWNLSSVPRPRKYALVHEKLDGICENLELAMPLTLAAEAEGVGRTTIYEAMEADAAILERITRARAIGAKTLTVLAKS